MRGVALIRWHVPCTELRMITAILANLLTFDCQITKTYIFEIFLRYRPHQCTIFIVICHPENHLILNWIDMF